MENHRLACRTGKLTPPGETQPLGVAMQVERSSFVRGVAEIADRPSLVNRRTLEVMEFRDVETKVVWCVGGLLTIVTGGVSLCSFGNTVALNSVSAPPTNCNDSPNTINATPCRSNMACSAGLPVGD